MGRFVHILSSRTSMDFLNMLGETITVTGKQVVKKAKDFADLSSLNSQLMSEKDKIRNAYHSIGEKYYQEFKEIPPEGYSEDFQVIKESTKKAALLKEGVRQLRGVRICKNCNCENPARSQFCNYCGQKLDAVHPVSEQDPDIFED